MVDDVIERYRAAVSAWHDDDSEDDYSTIATALDAGDALVAELASYRQAFGPLVIGAEPVKSFAAYELQRARERIAELEEALREVQYLDLIEDGDFKGDRSAALGQAADAARAALGEKTR